MPAEMDRCVMHIMGRTNKRTGKNFTKSEAFAVCTSMMKKSGGAMKKESMTEQQKIELLENQEINITEKLSFLENQETKELEITYTVAEAGVSGNNRRYTTKDLESQGLKGLKMFCDHSYEADNAVGIIKDSWMDGRKLKAKAVIKNSAKHPDIMEMIRDGRVDSVSIGGMGDIKRVRENDKEIEEISNLQVKEVSFVGIPGVSRAKITKIGG